MKTQRNTTSAAMRKVLDAADAAQKVKVMDTILVLVPQLHFTNLVLLAGEGIQAKEEANELIRKISGLEGNKSKTTHSKNPNELMSSQQVASELGITTKALEKWRVNGDGPVYVKLGNGPRAHVRYKRKVIEDYIALFTRDHTSRHTA